MVIVISELLYQMSVRLIFFVFQKRSIKEEKKKNNLKKLCRDFSVIDQTRMTTVLTDKLCYWEK